MKDILQYLTEPGEDTPVIGIEAMAGRIQRAFPDRAVWNEQIRGSTLAAEEKLWLVVP